jgi:stage V sporulation protein B
VAGAINRIEDGKKQVSIIERERKNESFFSGVLVLSLSAVIVKIIGLVYKIPMLKLLGSEGMGYFNSAYEIYALFCVIATSGLPVAMSVLISSSGDNKSRAAHILRVALRLFFALGIVGAFTMLALAKPLAEFFGSDKAFYCIAAISPTVFLICISSAYRGYFQGLGKMLPTAISQVIEALGKLFIGLALAFVAFDMGFSGEIVAAFAVMGLTLGTAVSALYLALSQRFARVKEPMTLSGTERAEKRKIAYKLLRIAFPITLSSAVISIVRVIDMAMILRRMQSAGMPSDEVFAAYGSYTTLAVPLFSVAPSLITAVSLPLVPTLSAAIGEGNEGAQRRAIGDAVKLTCMLAMPISFGLCLFAPQILSLVFSGEEQAIVTSAPLLSILSLSVPLSCLVTIGNAILQSYGRASIPIWSMTAGAIIKIILAYFLIGNKDIGIAGAPISTLLCDLTINAINFYCINKQLPSPIRISDTVARPFAASLISVTSARILYMLAEKRMGESSPLTLLAIGAAALIYLPIGLMTGAIDINMMAEMPVLKRFVPQRYKNANKQ